LSTTTSADSCQPPKKDVIWSNEHSRPCQNQEYQSDGRKENVTVADTELKKLITTATNNHEKINLDIFNFATLKEDKKRMSKEHLILFQ